MEERNSIRTNTYKEWKVKKLKEETIHSRRPRGRLRAAGRGWLPCARPVVCDRFRVDVSHPKGDNRGRSWRKPVPREGAENG
jgi:hypothetical protein